MFFPLAEVVKLVDTHVSGTCEETRGGSSPLLGTKKKLSWNEMSKKSSDKAPLLKQKLHSYF